MTKSTLPLTSGASCSTRHDYASAAAGVTVENCDAEPIHMPGLTGPLGLMDSSCSTTGSAELQASRRQYRTPQAGSSWHRGPRGTRLLLMAPGISGGITMNCEIQQRFREPGMACRGRKSEDFVANWLRNFGTPKLRHLVTGRLYGRRGMLQHQDSENGQRSDKGQT